jgi:hypothetical protein
MVVIPIVEKQIGIDGIGFKRRACMTRRSGFYQSSVSSGIPSRQRGSAWLEQPH